MHYGPLSNGTWRLGGVASTPSCSWMAAIRKLLYDIVAAFQLGPLNSRLRPVRRLTTPAAAQPPRSIARCDAGVVSPAQDWRRAVQGSHWGGIVPNEPACCRDCANGLGRRLQHGRRRTRVVADALQRRRATSRLWPATKVGGAPSAGGAPSTGGGTKSATGVSIVGVAGCIGPLEP